MIRKDSEKQKRSMSRLFLGKAVSKPLKTGRIDDHMSCIRGRAAGISFYRKSSDRYT